MDTVEDEDTIVFITNNEPESDSLASLNLFAELDNMSLDNMDAFDFGNSDITGEETQNNNEDYSEKLDDAGAVEMHNMELFGTDSELLIEHNLKYDVLYVFLKEFDYSPLEGLDIALVQDDKVIYNVTTDEAGNARFTDIAEGCYNVKILSNLAFGDTELSLIHI